VQEGKCPLHYGALGRLSGQNFVFIVRKMAIPSRSISHVCEVVHVSDDAKLLRRYSVVGSCPTPNPVYATCHIILY
jgi:hypothetical protein